MEVKTEIMQLIQETLRPLDEGGLGRINTLRVQWGQVEWSERGLRESTYQQAKTILSILGAITLPICDAEVRVSRKNEVKLIIYML